MGVGLTIEGLGVMEDENWETEEIEEIEDCVGVWGREWKDEVDVISEFALSGVGD